MQKRKDVNYPGLTLFSTSENIFCNSDTMYSNWMKKMWISRLSVNLCIWTLQVLSVSELKATQTRRGLQQKRINHN